MEKKYYLRGLGLGIIVTAVIMGIALSGGAVKREMTDEEVIARAKELGMTEDTRLLEPAEENQEEETPAEAQKPVKKDVAVKAEAEAQKTAAETEAQKKDTETAAEAEAQKKDDENAADVPAAADQADRTETKPSADKPEPKKDTNEMTKQDDEGNAKPSGTETDSSAKPTGTEANGGTKPVSGGTKSVTIVSGDSSYTIAKKLEAAGVVSSASSYDTYLCEHGYDKKLRTGTFQIPGDATEEQIAKIVTGQ